MRGSAVPHLTVHAGESDLAGHEQQLISRLTDAVAAVYGEWARPLVTIRLVGVAPGRWGVGGTIATRPAPAVTFGIKEEAFAHPQAPTLIATLANGVTTALADVMGADLRTAITIDFVATHPGRTAVGGVLES